MKRKTQSQSPSPAVEGKIEKLQRILQEKVAGYDLEAIAAQLERMLGTGLDKAVKKYYNEEKEGADGESESEL